MLTVLKAGLGCAERIVAHWPPLGEPVTKAFCSGEASTRTPAPVSG